MISNNRASPPAPVSGRQRPGGPPKSPALSSGMCAHAEQKSCKQLLTLEFTLGCELRALTLTSAEALWLFDTCAPVKHPNVERGRSSV